MRIRQSIHIATSPDSALVAARAWMRGELPEADGDFTSETTRDGSPTMTTVLDQDGIRMTTSVSARPHGAGSMVAIDLCTQGLTFGAKIRNLGLLPGRKLVREQTRASLREIKADAEQ